MKTNTTDNNDYAESEIDLAEVLRVLTRYKKLVLGMPLLFMTLAFIILNRMPPVWEAIALIQVGRIGHPSTQDPQLIEPIPQTLARIGTQQFKAAVLNDLNMHDMKSRAAGLYKTSLKVQQLKTTDLIELQVRGFSIEDAKTMAEGTVKYLRELHDKAAAPTVTLMKEQLAATKNDITKTQSMLEKFKQSIQSKNIKAEDLHFWTFFSANLTQQLSSDLKASQQQKLIYEEIMTPLRTYPTSLVNDIYVDEKPVSARKFLKAMLAGGIGLFLGACIALILNHINSGAVTVKKTAANALQD